MQPHTNNALQRTLYAHFVHAYGRLSFDVEQLVMLMRRAFVERQRAPRVPDVEFNSVQRHLSTASMDPFAAHDTRR